MDGFEFEKCGNAMLKCEGKILGGVEKATCTRKNSFTEIKEFFNDKPVGALYPIQHPAHRVGLFGTLADALRHSFNARYGQGQTVQHHIADVPLGRSHILSVGGKDGRLVLRIA